MKPGKTGATVVIAGLLAAGFSATQSVAFQPPIADAALPQNTPPIAPTPETPAAPGIEVPAEIMELASVYRTTMAGLAGMNTIFTSGPQVADAVKAGASFENQQLQQGAVAYGALIALQEPSFVASVRDYISHPGWLPALVANIEKNPANVSSVPNFDRAAGLVTAALDRSAAPAAVNGWVMIQAAYDTQLSPWSKVKVPNAVRRLGDAKLLSSQRLSAALEDITQLRRVTSGAEAAVSIAAEPVNEPTVIAAKSVALAALIVAGAAAEPENAPLVQSLLADQSVGFCLNIAKLTFYQCLSVAGAQYEDIFCVAKHALIEPATCVITAAGAPQTAFVQPALRKARKVVAPKAPPKAKTAAAPKAGAPKAKAPATKAAPKAAAVAPRAAPKTAPAAPKPAPKAAPKKK